jgi:hypothetical protein
MLKSFALVALTLGLAVAPGLAYADGSCAATAADKKLAGAAKTSFMTKCANDAKAACDKQADDKSLKGAARTSFTTKCAKDATGA